MKDFHDLEVNIYQELPPSKLLRKFEIAIGKLSKSWATYRPNDSLAKTRERDLKELQDIVQQYKQFSSDRIKRKFWQGYFEGKSNRRLIRKSNNLNVPLLSTLFDSRRKEAFELGLKTGWQYARLKSYLLRTEELERERFQKYQEIMLSQQDNARRHLDYTF